MKGRTYCCNGIHMEKERESGAQKLIFSKFPKLLRCLKLIRVLVDGFLNLFRQGRKIIRLMGKQRIPEYQTVGCVVHVITPRLV